MKSLIVIAHPNKKSFSHHISQIILEIYKKKGYEVELLDLYDHPQAYLELDECNHAISDNQTLAMQAQITRADEIIFCFPLWRFDCPAILKSWFEINFASGFAYCHIDGKFFPKALLEGKTTRVFITAGGPAFGYWFISWLIKTLWVVGRLGYVGLKLKSRLLIPDMGSYKIPASRERMVDKVRKIIS